MIQHFLLLAALQAVSPPGGQGAVVDSVRFEMSRGRFWHAAQRLEKAFPGCSGCDFQLLLLFAEAEAGWGNWAGVRALLGAPLEGGELNDPRAWYLLGRAMEDAGEWGGAAAAYGRALEQAGPGSTVSRVEVRARRARSECRARRYSECTVEVRTLVGEDSAVGGWVALEVAEGVAANGEGVATLTLLSLVGSPEMRALGWRLPGDALLAAGDSAGAEAAYWSAIPSLSPAPYRATAWERVGALRLARGDSAGARGAYHQVLRVSSGGAASLRAARSLAELGFDSVGVALAAADVLRAAGRLEDALSAYESYEHLLGPSGAPVSPQALLGKARAHLGLRQRREALSMAEDLEESVEPSVRAQALVLEAQALRALGREGEARAAEDRLVAGFPERPEAVEVLFLRAAASQDRGDVEKAIRGFAETAALSPAQNRAGEARMRIGQLLLGQDRLQDALDVYTSYMRDFPDGRRWDEAAFWAGRTLVRLDRGEEGQTIFASLRGRFPLTYYAVQAGSLTGDPFAPEIPDLPDTLPMPDAVRAGLARIDVLRAAGLERGASWEVDRLTREIRDDTEREGRQVRLLRLALELNGRGLTREGINLGWEVQREGRPWDRNLLRAIYPFPYRSIVVAEARERGLDPYLMAGLIRQESAFWAEALSRADARGLMQVLPSTGAELARAVGPGRFRPDEQLYRPEINVHLGTAFFADLVRRFGDNPSILLSAYNAGPTRALRWRSFPEVEDLPRFVERIPFTETRGYVKNVLLNRAIYTWLYSDEEEGETTSRPDRFRP